MYPGAGSFFTEGAMLSVQNIIRRVRFGCGRGGRFGIVEPPNGVRRVRFGWGIPLMLLLAGCGILPEQGPPELPSEVGANRAALSVVLVHNRTPDTLAILYRGPGAEANEIQIGRAAPNVTVRMAPIPAGEPIRLLARRPDRAELVLPLRSYDLNAEWLWDIPATAAFVYPE